MHEEHFSPPLKTLEMKLYSVLTHDPVGDQTGEHILISFLVLNLRLWEEGQKKKVLAWALGRTRAGGGVSSWASDATIVKWNDSF